MLKLWTNDKFKKYNLPGSAIVVAETNVQAANLLRRVLWQDWILETDVRTEDMEEFIVTGGTVLVMSAGKD